MHAWSCATHVDTTHEGLLRESSLMFYTSYLWRGSFTVGRERLSNPAFFRFHFFIYLGRRGHTLGSPAVTLRLLGREVLARRGLRIEVQAGMTEGRNGSRNPTGF